MDHSQFDKSCINWGFVKDISYLGSTKHWFMHQHLSTLQPQSLPLLLLSVTSLMLKILQETARLRQKVGPVAWGQMAGDLKANWYLEGGPTFVFEYILNLYLYLYIYLYMHLYLYLYLYLLGVKRQETWKPIMLWWIHQYLSTLPPLPLHVSNRKISLCSWRQVSVWSTWTLHLTQVASDGAGSQVAGRSQAKPSKSCGQSSRPNQPSSPVRAGFKWTLARSASRAPQPWPGTPGDPQHHWNNQRNLR